MNLVFRVTPVGISRAMLVRPDDLRTYLFSWKPCIFFLGVDLGHSVTQGLKSPVIDQARCCEFEARRPACLVEGSRGITGFTVG